MMNTQTDSFSLAVAPERKPARSEVLARMLAEIGAPKPPQKTSEASRSQVTGRRELRPFAYD